MNKERASKALSDKLERPVSEQEALRYLTMAGEGNTDQVYQRQYANDLGLQTSEERQLYNAAKQYIAQYARESFIDDRGQKQSLFVAKGNDFRDGSVYGQYRNDQAYRDFYWNTRGDNLNPDNPTAQELAVYQQREKIRLENSAKQLATGAIPAVMGWTAGAIVKNGTKTGSKPEAVRVGQQAAEVPGKVQDEIAALHRMKDNPAGTDLTNKAPDTVLNLQISKETTRNPQAVNDLQNGKLPGTPIGDPWTPREMTPSVNPNRVVENFAFQFFGGKRPAAEQYLRQGLPNVAGKPCPECWVAKSSDGTVVTYRPAGLLAMAHCRRQRA